VRWLLNRLVNPVVRGILRSPLHRLLSRSLLLVTYQGRRTGRSFTTPVMYAADGDGGVVIVPGWAERKRWWRNLRGAAPVRLLVRGQTVDGWGVVVTDHAERVAALRAYLARYPRAARQHGVHRADGDWDAGDLEAAADQTVVITVRPVRTWPTDLA